MMAEVAQELTAFEATGDAFWVAAQRFFVSQLVTAVEAVLTAEEAPEEPKTRVARQEDSFAA